MPDIDVKKTISHSHSLDLLFCVVAFGLATVIGLAATTSGPGVNPDAATYISMGANIYQGLGFVTNITTADGPTSFAPVTLWPPAYSILIASLMNFGLSAIEAARWSSILSFGLLGGTVYWLGSIIGGRTTGTLAALSTILLMPVARTATFALTEITFLAFSALAIAGMIQFVRIGTNSQLVWLVFGGIFTALAMLTRYIGGIWLLIGLCVIFLVTIRRWKRWLAYSFLFGAIAVLPSIPWFIRNLRLTGHFSGLDRSEGFHPTLSENISYFLGTYARDLIPSMHLGIRGIIQSMPFYGWSLLLAIGIGAILLLWWAGFGRYLQNTISQNLINYSRWQKSLWLWLVVLFYAGGYAGVIFWLSNRSLFPSYDWQRYLTPTYPLILVLWSAGWVAAAQTLTAGRPNWLRTIAVVAPALIWLLPYGIQTAGFVQEAAKGQEFTSAKWRQSQVLASLSTILAPTDRVYSDTPGAVSFRLNHPVRYLPPTGAQEEFVDLIDQSERLGAKQYVIIFKGPLENTDPYFNTRLTGADISAMAATRPDIQIVANFEDGSIYQLGHPSLTTSSTLDQ